MGYDEKTAARVREALSGRRDVVEKKLMGGLSFMVKGGMCCSVSGKGGLLIRIDESERDRLLSQPYVQPMEMGGRIMSGFVRIAPDGYRTDAALRTWIDRGLAAAARRAARPPAKSSKRMAQKPPKRVGVRP